MGRFVTFFVCYGRTFLRHDSTATLATASALSQGLLFGGIVVLLQRRFPHVVFGLVMVGPAVFAAMLLVRRFGTFYRLSPISCLSRATLAAFLAACAGMALFAIVVIGVQGFAGAGELARRSGLWGLLAFLLIGAAAAVILTADFDFVADRIVGRRSRAMEWYSASALVFVLSWMYVEVFRRLRGGSAF